jgi:uncharacterized membrane protein YhaH (DUF805 family)
MHWYTDVIRRYADFDGRAGRPEFWWFQLINIAIYVLILIVVTAAVGFGTAELIASVYSLAVFLPGLGVDIRRLHDTDRSGWWVLLGLIPFAGGLALLVLFALAGTSGPNRYGPSPSATLVEPVGY